MKGFGFVVLAERDTSVTFDVERHSGVTFGAGGRG
jgi:hypothetical protein